MTIDSAQGPSTADSEVRDFALFNAETRRCREGGSDGDLGFRMADWEGRNAETQRRGERRQKGAAPWVSPTWKVS